jgi:hypothetical protein
MSVLSPNAAQCDAPETALRPAAVQPVPGRGMTGSVRYGTRSGHPHPQGHRRDRPNPAALPAVPATGASRAPDRPRLPRRRKPVYRACPSCDQRMIAKTSRFAKTFQLIRREIYVRKKVFVIMPGTLVRYFARRETCRAELTRPARSARQGVRTFQTAGCRGSRNVVPTGQPWCAPGLSMASESLNLATLRYDTKVFMKKEGYSGLTPPRLH